MSTLISSIARVSSIARAIGLGPTGPVGLAGLAGRRAGGVAVPLLVAGALAAGCASAHTGASPGSTAGNAAPGHATGTAGPAAPAASGTAGPAAPATSGTAAPAIPVPTVSGGNAGTGGAACAGWPSGATSTSLPASFVPVSVERCVHGVQTIPGKGLWTTATLQRSDSDLTGLMNALRMPPATHRPGTVCPAIAVVPSEVVLIGANGQKLIPRLPVSGCGLTQSQVLVALNSLSWQPVSVRLVAKIPGQTAPAASGGPPHSSQTVSGVQPQ